AYALLLGSGLSRSSGIPTGYEITLEMIRQLAALHGGGEGQDLEEWYTKKFGSSPGYSELLDRLGKTPTERHGFLRQFFEPTEQEKEEGKKKPTSAHRAIAKMVSSGVIRVIVTTNFDRLLEQAIQDEGITPTVIASSDAVDGATPLVHSRCTIIKVNGDYLDTRAKNTVDELEQYDERMIRILDQVFDEFGLIVCGWSGDWDKALRSCVERTKGRRYSCYWCVKGEPSPLASGLMDLRAAVRVPIESADMFFAAVEEKLVSLEEINRPHPLSAQLAVASLKRYIVEDRYRIKLHDLVMDEVNRVCVDLGASRYPMSGSPVPSGETAQARVNQYAADLSILLPLFINLCHWGRSEHEELAVKAIERVANFIPNKGGYEWWTALRLYPASLLLCAGGVAAIHSNRTSLFFKLLAGFKVKGINDSNHAMDDLLPYQILDQRSGQQFPDKDRKYTPINNLVFETLRPYFIELLPTDDDFEKAFDRFEYLAAMVYVDVIPRLRGEENDEYSWAPPGRFSWKRTFGDHVSKLIESEITEQGQHWPPLREGLFGGKLEQAKIVKGRLDKFTSKLNWSW
ncbi:MAG TPA: SIR2 family protein, partial [Bdellovibrio sp.]|nr:SIR2 family protein [Bdellovibrio sp.]